MKHLILNELKRKLGPQWKRKMKIFLMVGVVFVVVASSLLIWAGIAAVGYVANVVKQPGTYAHVENLRSEISALPALAAVGCWSRAESLLQVQPWIQRPLVENLNSLKVACLGPAATVCQGEDCNETKAPDKADESEETI